ncbi:peptidase M20 [Limnohabitans sp. T6-5]|uniref:glutamate carboxypeptidase n=1 Tax=Limnohabitans sp. T6-5 TaxID=1100724 RepID=UPI000D37D9A8|nr:glutamate carboxypeptidase [Limnohabitans sp. T6-5]PUE06318.1 peptidase M20 [Limnohabitans sp. T6-5]
MKSTVLARYLALVALTVCTTAWAQKRDDALFAAAQGAQAAVIDTLQQLVMIESGSGNLPGLSRVADLAQARLQALGAQTERIRTSNSERVMVKGSFTGTGRLKAMLIAHMDTVYPDGILASQPYKLDGNRLYGPGIADDKGGIAVILHSLALLKAQGWTDFARITVLFNPDEEIGSGGSGALIESLAAQHDVVLSYEPTAAKSMAKVEGVLLSAAGTATATLEVKGRAAHAGAAPEEGRNALIELSHQMLATQDIAKGIPGAQLNWTYAQGGLVRNQIPEKAVATADVRLLKPDAAEKLKAALLAKTSESHRVPDTHVHVQLEVGRPPYVAGERGTALAQRARAIYAELDGRPLFFHPVTGGGTDAGFASGSGKAAVLESLGLAGWGFHARDEYIEIDSIVPRLYLTSRLLQDLGKAP